MSSAKQTVQEVSWEAANAARPGWSDGVWGSAKPSGVTPLGRPSASHAFLATQAVETALSESTRQFDVTANLNTFLALSGVICYWRGQCRGAQRIWHLPAMQQEGRDCPGGGADAPLVLPPDPSEPRGPREQCLLQACGACWTGRLAIPCPASSPAWPLASV